jgi:hypothetical protein
MTWYMSSTWPAQTDLLSTARFSTFSRLLRM